MQVKKIIQRTDDLSNKKWVMKDLRCRTLLMYVRKIWYLPCHGPWAPMARKIDLHTSGTIQPQFIDLVLMWRPFWDVLLRKKKKTICLRCQTTHDLLSYETPQTSNRMISISISISNILYPIFQGHLRQPLLPSLLIPAGRLTDLTVATVPFSTPFGGVDTRSHTAPPRNLHVRNQGRASKRKRYLCLYFHVQETSTSEYRLPSQMPSR